MSVKSLVTQEEKWVKAILPQHPQIKQFIEHCSQLRHSFCIKSVASSTVLYANHLDFVLLSLNSGVNFFPDPTPDSYGHCKSFETFYGTMTDEEHRPSLQKATARSKTLPIVASVQHAKKTPTW